LQQVAHPLAGEPLVAWKGKRRGIERREQAVARPRDCLGLEGRRSLRLGGVVVPVAEPTDLYVAVGTTVAGFLREVVPPDRLEVRLRGTSGAQDVLRVGELRGRSAPPGGELPCERKEDCSRSLRASRVHRGKVNEAVGQQARTVARSRLMMQVVPSWPVQAKEAVC